MGEDNNPVKHIDVTDDNSNGTMNLPALVFFLVTHSPYFVLRSHHYE
jgi:hypothetical protein